MLGLTLWGKDLNRTTPPDPPVSKGELLLPDSLDLDHWFLLSDLSRNVGSFWVLRLPLLTLEVPYQLSGSPAYPLRTLGPLKPL